MLAPAASLHSNLTQDASSSEDEEDRLRREEEEEIEQERQLSRQFGEADEFSSSNKKRSIHQTDAEIADALNSKSSAGSSDGTNKVKKKRKTLNETILTGSKGLIFIRREFPSQLQYKDPKKSMMKKRPSRFASETQQRAFKRELFETEVNASASYLSTLMKAYQSVALVISPNMHHTDTFNKIQDLGKKKPVRDYLNTMREEICKDHLSKVYGNAKAEKLVNELEHGLEVHKERLLNDDGFSGVDESTVIDSKSHLALNNMRAVRGVGAMVENNSLVDDRTDGDDNASNRDNDINVTEDINSSNDKNANESDSEDEEETEATFDEIVGSSISPAVEEEELKQQGTNDDKEDEIEPTAETLDKAMTSQEVIEMSNAVVNEKTNTETVLVASNKSQEEGGNDSDDDSKTRIEESVIVEFSQTQENDTEEQITLDATQNLEETQLTMSQASFSQSSTQEQLTLDAESMAQSKLAQSETQELTETQTIVPTLTPAASQFEIMSQEY